MDDGAIDHEARHKADMAMKAIETHENHCGERWKEARKASEELRTTMREGFSCARESESKLHGRINKLMIIIGVAAFGFFGNVALALMEWGAP